MVHWPGDTPFERLDTLRLATGGSCNLSELRTSAHIGTHMDAPKHFLEGGASIDTLPIAAVIGPARIIEIQDPELIRIAELEPYRLSAGERTLFKTRNSALSWKTSEFQQRYVYIPRDTAEYLAERRLQTVGVDYLSVGGFKKDSAETHRALLGAGIWIIEGLDLSQVSPGDYELVCLPLRILGSDGSPARAVLRPLSR
jgi:arylformamidase